MKLDYWADWFGVHSGLYCGVRYGPLTLGVQSDGIRGVSLGIEMWFKKYNAGVYLQLGWFTLVMSWDRLYVRDDNKDSGATDTVANNTQ